MTRRTLLIAVGALWLAATVAALAVSSQPDPVVVTHWANSHLMRPQLLPAFAEQFNRAGHTTRDGRPIVVKAVANGSSETADELVSRAGRGVPINPDLPDPTIVTPSADHWLVHVNHAVGRAVVDLGATESIARTWIGIATFREMAECLGWPEKEIGYAEVVALRNDPRGWAAYPCAKAEWGQRPLVAFTDPLTSSSGRSTLFSLYAIAAGKPAEQLTPADVARPAVAEYVRGFQRAVDHYVVGTLPLNTKIFLGPRYGHFFFIPEDNLVHLYQGKESVQVGMQRRREPLSRPMVMIYPKEGSTAHSHSAGIVQADWVAPEQTEAARAWVAFLHEEAQQRALMAEGFRPATPLPPTDPISGRYGLDPAKPSRTVDPDRIDPAAAAAIVGAWDDVKKPGIATFVVDASGSMAGNKLAQAKAGLVRAIDAMSAKNRVGYLAFGDRIRQRVPVAPLTENRFAIAQAVESTNATGSTALYDAIRAAVEMTDAAPGEADTIRGVVVLTDGLANHGETTLDQLIRMTSRDEVPIRSFRGFERQNDAVDGNGRRVDRGALLGAGLAVETRHPILVFFVGIGDADLEVGRLLAEATGASFNGATEKDLAAVLEQFGRYF